MPNFYEDHALIFWAPFTEDPSGAPSFRNLAPRTNALTRASGITFDFIPSLVTSNPVFEQLGMWPGTVEFNDPVSGQRIRGFMCQGAADFVDGDEQTAKNLHWGEGGFETKDLFIPPDFPQSGFTIGMWVYPNSNNSFDHGATSADNDTNAERVDFGERNALITRQTLNGGFNFGVSGRLENAVQFEGGPHRESSLRAYVSTLVTSTTPGVTLTTPIESGVFTHLTFVYRKGEGTESQFALFKNGRLVQNNTTDREFGSGISTNNNARLNLGESDFQNVPFIIGGARTLADGAAIPTGYNNVVSGVYYFNRPMHDGEVMEMHDGGGIQAGSSFVPPEMKEVSISDKSIIAYVPFISPGYIDVSRRHHNFYGNFDEGPEDFNFTQTGPLGRGGVMNDTNGSNDDGTLSCGSGLIEDILRARSFTLAGNFLVPGDSQTFDDSLMMSWGAIGSNYNTITSGPDSALLLITASGSAASNILISALVHPHGRKVPSLSANLGGTKDFAAWCHHHVAFAYDDQTRGVALYVNGNLTQSGTLDRSFIDQATQVAYSGFPLLVAGGITGPNMSNAYDNGSSLRVGTSELLVVGRPMQPEEIKYVATSGINIDRLSYTLHDPRLRGHWQFRGGLRNDIFVPDLAGPFSGPGCIPGHMISHAGVGSLEDVRESETGDAHFLIDKYGLNYGTDPSGIVCATSGVWGVMGGTPGTRGINTISVLLRNSSSNDLSARYRMFAEERDITSPKILSDYVWMFTVTPSGNIQPNFGLDNDAASVFNSVVMNYGHMSTTADFRDRLYAYLTTADDGELRIVWAAENSDPQDASPTQQALCSGTLPYGVPSQVLFHAKPRSPNLVSANDEDNTELELACWVNGVRRDFQTLSPSDSLIYSDQSRGANDDWILSIGGRSISSDHDDISSTVQLERTVRDGLGEIHMRDVSILCGIISAQDVRELAVSGIRVTSPLNFDTPFLAQSTPVLIDDDFLEGYWRFSSPSNPDASGITDLSLKGNDLYHNARQLANDGGFSSDDNSAYNLRFTPAGFSNASTRQAASGITYAGNQPALTANNAAAPFLVSGERFQIPQSGFTVGFWHQGGVDNSDLVGSNDWHTLLSYGGGPNTQASTAFFDCSWMVYVDENENIRMMLSRDGRINIEDGTNALQVSCGLVRVGADKSTTSFENELWKRDGRLQRHYYTDWGHHIWSYDHNGGSTSGSRGTLTYYFNGVQVDQQEVPASGFHQPLNPALRYINIMGMTQDEPWDWFEGQAVPIADVMTDLFYMSRPINQFEARDLAAQGIRQPPPTFGSGFFGGYIIGLEGGFGHLGGYSLGQDLGSGFFGGYVEGVLESSGVFGGFARGQALGSGFLGGLAFGADNGSGVLGGYTTAVNSTSGFMGGYTIGGSPSSDTFDGGFTVTAFNNADFDAQVTVVDTLNADFDAQVTVFQPECPPDIAIIVPEGPTVSGEAIPFKQYFVGSGTAQAPKTIVDARWFFSDLTGSFKVSASGAGGDLFPIEHTFAQSGFYVARFSLIDSAGLRTSTTVYVDLASGVPPINMTLSGVPNQGVAPLNVQFAQTFESLPPGVSVIGNLLDFDDGQNTTGLNKKHNYTEPGLYCPIWVVRDSRGLRWSDSLDPGIDLIPE